MVCGGGGGGSGSGGGGGGSGRGGGSSSGDGGGNSDNGNGGRVRRNKKTSNHCDDITMRISTIYRYMYICCYKMSYVWIYIIL